MAWIDQTTRCNLSCPLCYTKQSRGKLDFGPGDLEMAIRKLASSKMVEAKTIHLNWLGEPLMNPRFVELLAIAAAYCRTLSNSDTRTGLC